MTPYHSDPWLTVYQGDCREVMAQMEPESVHCVVTSPPYWGLRDYGIGGQLGLEPTPEQYVENMVAVFREVRRVLRKDGTCWVNLGDTYNSRLDGSHGGWNGSTPTPQRTMNYGSSVVDKPRYAGKPKDLVGIPWRVAFALQADGWYLRSDIIWSKPNPMPESVTDRPTKAHEYLFLLTKSPRYYYDADAVREPYNGPMYDGRDNGAILNGDRADRGKTVGMTNPAGRNIRSVWTIATQPYPGAHFATFPEALVEPCVKAGSSERGICPECGAPWTRETSVAYEFTQAVHNRTKHNGEATFGDRSATMGVPANKISTTTGWRPSCAHDLPPVPATVLDPFAGSGTTGRVAQRLGRKAVLIDLSGEYLTQTMKRNADIPLGLETA